MTYYGASYLPPTSSSATFDSSSFNRANEALTYQTALDNFLAYPTAQGTENLKTTNISGVLTLTNDLIINGDNYIQFPDTTKQTTAFVEANYAQLNTDNTFFTPNTQTFQGSNASVGLTAPLVISNSQTSNKASLYIDDANNLDATLYSNQTDGGLTVRNAGGFSFTLAPLGANTATFANPISCGANPLTCGALSATSISGSSVNIGSGTIACGTINTNTLGATGNIVSGGTITGTQLLLGTGAITSGAITSSGAISGTQLSLTSGANTTLFTTTGTGLNVADSITSTGNITATNSLSATNSINTQTGDLYIGGESTFARTSNLGATPILSTSNGLYIGRNKTNSSNEFDIIAVNSTTSTALNIYSSQTTDIMAATVPTISIANNSAYLNGNQIATTNQIIGGSYTVGQIITGIFTTPPTNFLLCNGQQIPQTSYPQLFALIGTVYSDYNGFVSGYYSLPDLRESFPIGSNSTYTSGGKTVPAYTDSATLNAAQGGNNLVTNVYAHSHSVTGNPHYHGYGTGYSNVAVGSNSGTCATQTGGTPNYYSTQTVSTTGITNSVGGGNISNLSQFVAVYYYIYAGTP